MASLTGVLTRNWSLKLSAFAVALLLWFAVRAEAPSRQELIGIPVEVELADPGWVVVDGPSPATVSLRMAGPSRELLGVTADRPALVIPIDEVTAADTTVPLRSAWVRFGDRPGVVVEGIEPQAVTVALQPLEGRILPAAARVHGELPAGWALAASPQAFPEGVRVSGPAGRLAGLDSVHLLPVDLAGVTGPGRIRVAVDTAGLGGLVIRPAAVQLEMLVEERVERVVSGIPVVLPPGGWDEGEGFPSRVEIRPESASAIVRGARSVVDRTDPTLFSLVVRITPGELPPPGAEAEFPIALAGLPPLLGGEPDRPVITLRNLGAGSGP